MTIFTVYSEAQAGILRLWAQSWKARGWTPKLVTRKKEKQGRFSYSFVINFSQRPTRKPLRPVKFGARGWQDAPLVRFPETVTVQQVLDCGRVVLKKGVAL